MRLQITPALHRLVQLQHLINITSELSIIKKPFTGFDSRQKHTPVKGFSMR